MTKAAIAADSPALYPAAWPAVLAVYGAALLQGMTLVSFPAVSSVLKQTLALTDAGYGALFLPQVALAVTGALAGGGLAKSLGLKALLAMALAANGVSQLLLAASAYASPAGGFALLFAGTSSLGFGFGLIGGPINAFPALLFPRRAETAIVVAHTLIGLGLAVGPLIAGLFAAAGAWTAFPALLAGACVAGALSTLLVMFPDPAPAAGDEFVSKPPFASTAFWLFVAITVIYAFAEGTFSNWAVIFLRDVKGLPDMTASFALSAFWGMLVAGRLLVSLLILRIPLRFIWIALPVLMIAAFWLVPQANGAAAGIGAFALAGLAGSAFLPLTISLAAARFPANVAWVSSMLIAALMTGVGVGSWLTGALQARLSLDMLYRLSSIYPLLVLALAWLILRRSGVNRESQAMSPAPNSSCMRDWMVEDRVADYRKTPEAVSRLTPEQYRVTQQNGTEAPGRGAYLDNNEPGIYVDIVSGEALFASSAKFESGCGWPSFTKPIEPVNIKELRDTSHGMIRTEVRSAFGDSHLGHVFDDDPEDRGGLRYCINSASVRFIPRDRMEAEGYGAYLDQVQDIQ